MQRSLLGDEQLPESTLHNLLERGTKNSLSYAFLPNS